MKEYRNIGNQEIATSETMKAENLTPEIRESMGLDLFPLDIQNDILNLVKKITDLGIKITEESNDESTLESFGGFQGCMAHAPVRSMVRDAFHTARQTAKYTRMVPRAMPFGVQIRTYGPAATGLACFGGGMAGHTVGCIQRHR